MSDFAIIYTYQQTQREIKMKANTVTTLATAIGLGLFLSMVAAEAAATVTETYAVQGDIKTVIAPKSGLTKASCKFLDKQGRRIAGQNVTVVETYDDITVIEANLYFEQHAKVVIVECVK